MIGMTTLGQLGVETLEVSNETIRNNFTNYFGAITNWKTNNDYTNDIIWKILYADEGGTYLIADDYVKANQIPKTKNNNTINLRQGYEDYYFEIPSISNDYTGIENSNKIVQWYQYSGSASINSKCVDYLLDVNKWNEIYPGEGLEWAIGGPTMEMANAIQEIFNGEKEPRVLSEYGWTIDPNGEKQDVLEGSELMYMNGRINLIFGYPQKGKPKNVYMASTGNKGNSLYIVNTESGKLLENKIYRTK